MQPPLSRVDLAVPLGNLLNELAVSYDLGKILRYGPIGEGYEDLNIKTVTEKGTCLVKVFPREKTHANNQDYVKALLGFSGAGIPVPEPFKTRDGRFLYKTGGNAYLCVMEFFDGKSLREIRPTDEDLKAIARYLAKIHKLSFRVGRGNYDSWGTANLLKEFEKRKSYLNHEDLRLIEPVVEGFRKIDFSKFRTCIIHGDLQRGHVLKSDDGRYCILDLGCVNFDSAAVDLAIFIAHFCLDPDSPAEENMRRYKLTVREYLKKNSLNPAELDSLPLLVKATYAIYAIRANYEIKAENDKSKQTKAWLGFGRNGLYISARLFP
jgi:Ser/Thr protein kinase RdoA (MazF antagonist)